MPRTPHHLAFDRLHRFLTAFRRDEGGSITVEAVLMVPLLCWCYLGTFVFFDAFRMQSNNIKTSYTIGDTLSRETGFVTNNYMQSLSNLQGLMLSTDEPRSLQVTMFTYNQAQDRYTVVWSRSRGALPQLTTADLLALRSILPRMPDGERSILTRSRVHYAPAFRVGLNPFIFDEFTVTRPRFSPQICWNTVENGNHSTATC